MAIQIGIIAEDQSDIDSLYEFACKISRENTFKFRKFVGHGCGKLRRKCRAWAENLKTRGCAYLIVVHDLDDRNEADLRAELEALVFGTGYSRHIIVIPIRELESWLLCDPDAIRVVFRPRRQIRLPANPESILDPKRELAQIIKATSGITYVNTIHNKKIARESSIERIQSRCQSFVPYVSFLQSIFQV